MSKTWPARSWAPPLAAEHAALARVARDLGIGEHRLRRIAASVGSGSGMPITLVLDFGPDRVGLACEAGEPVDVVAWRFAIQVQEYLLDRDGRPVPACPAHRRSLVPDMALSGARWVCPSGRAHLVRPIGELHSPAPR